MVNKTYVQYQGPFEFNAPTALQEHVDYSILRIGIIKKIHSLESFGKVRLHNRGTRHLADGLDIDHTTEMGEENTMEAEYLAKVLKLYFVEGFLYLIRKVLGVMKGDDGVVSGDRFLLNHQQDQTRPGR